MQRYQDAGGRHVVTVHQLVPESGEVDVRELAGRLTSAGDAPPPFAPETLAFCGELASALSRSPEARGSGELQALAFWIRRAELQRLRDQFDALRTERTRLVPRGLVFHLPPSNVDTMFAYSWVLSLLVGNRNVVRLSERRSRQSAAICAIVARLLQAREFETVRRTTAIVTYGHDTAVTQALSAVADVRVIWGGDRTVNDIRAVRLPPHARELTFVDRSSLCVIAAVRYLALDDDGRQGLAARFYNDVYWFDQGACSSPRLVVWCGGADAAQRASRLFFSELRRVTAERKYLVKTATALNKFSFACRAVLNAGVTRYERLSNAVTVLDLEDSSDVPAEHCGAGLFFQMRVDDLSDIVRLVRRRDQTLTSFGFDFDALDRLAAALNGRGIDRLVPIGQALTFNRFWDGVDLLQELTRRVYVEAEW